MHIVAFIAYATVAGLLGLAYEDYDRPYYRKYGKEANK